MCRAAELVLDLIQGPMISPEVAIYYIVDGEETGNQNVRPAVHL